MSEGLSALLEVATRAQEAAENWDAPGDTAARLKAVSDLAGVEAEVWVALVREAQAARALHDFLENERETKEPPADLLDMGYVAVETAADYDRLEVLGLAFGAARDATDRATSNLAPTTSKDLEP